MNTRVDNKKHISLSQLMLILCLFTLELTSAAQDSILEYYRLERKARILNEQNEKDSSLVYYLKAIPLNQECPVSVLKTALKLSKSLQNDSAASLFEIRIIQQRSRFNSAYAEEINRLFKQDQKARSSKNMKIRQQYSECITSGLCSYDEIAMYKKALDEWNLVDSSNIQQLLHLITTHGFPSENLVGDRGYYHASILLVHFDKDTNNEILGPIISSALHQGKMRPRDYAWIVDRRAMNSGQNPYYYHIPSVHYNALSLEEKETVDKRRSEIGLGKIAESQLIIRTKKGFKVKYID